MATLLRPRLRTLTSTLPSSLTSSLPSSLTFARTMATKRDYLVIVPDAPGMHAKRMEVRPTHFANLAPLFEKDEWKMGGALLKSEPQGADPNGFDFHGSTMVVAAESKEDILKVLREDVYAKEGVWDLEKIQILPFLCAFRKAL